MSIPYTLKQILADAARYQWARENLEYTFVSFSNGKTVEIRAASDLDDYVDGELSK